MYHTDSLLNTRVPTAKGRVDPFNDLLPEKSKNILLGRRPFREGGSVCCSRCTSSMMSQRIGAIITEGSKMGP